MNEKEQKIVNCPICNSIAEIGCLMGNSGSFDVGFQWYEGNPTIWRNIVPHGEPVGDFEIFKGAFLRGLRCIKCRKLILDY